MPALLRDIASVLKLRIGVAIAMAAVAGLMVAPASADVTPVGAGKAALLALCVLAASCSAGAFNQHLERELDARMPRTRTRPFARGAFRPGLIWLLGIGVLLAGAVSATLVAVGGMAALYVFLGAFVYGVVYTVWLKRRTAWNIVVGGLAGSFAVLAGAAAADPWPSANPIILALVLFLWTPPHFWSLAMARRAEYAQAGVPMLPVIAGDTRAAWMILCHTVALVTLSLLPAAMGLGWIYAIPTLIGDALFIWCSLALVRAPTQAAAMANFHASLMPLSLMLLGAIADRALAA